MRASAAAVVVLLSVIWGRLHVSLGQGVGVPPSSGGAPGCDPACVRGICKQAVNSAALYCDCSGTGFRGPLCNTSQSIAPSSGAPALSPTSSRCSPVCQNAGACRQEVNSAAFYCDCSRTGYKGATCSAPSLASGPSANLSAATSPCSPPCQHGGLCKQEVNSAAYYCDCSRTGFRGAFCSAQANASSPVTAVQAVPSNASSCTPACQNGGTCKQAVNSGAYYCDCGRTSYKGATCSALAAYSPAVSAASNTSACSPPCKNGAPCKQEANSGAYYCRCQGTAFTGQDCSIVRGSSAAVGGIGSEGAGAYDATGGAQGGGSSSIAWWGILVIVVACAGGLVLFGCLGMLLVQRIRSSRAGSFARFKEEGKFYNGAPEHTHGIEATRM